MLGVYGVGFQGFGVCRGWCLGFKGFAVKDDVSAWDVECIGPTKKLGSFKEVWLGVQGLGEV